MRYVTKEIPALRFIAPRLGMVVLFFFALPPGIVLAQADSDAIISVHAEQDLVDTSFQVENDLGSGGGKVEAGTEGQVTLDENGLEGSLRIGLAAELEAASKRFGVGNEDVGASANIDAKVEALIGAEGSISAYFDENGITLGGQAEAGAFVSAEAGVNFEAHFFGLQTNVRAYVEGHAGILAHGEALVQIGFDGKISFELGAGLAVGLGASAGVQFDVDAEELMEQLGLQDLSELLVWIDEFQEDPESTVNELLGKATDELLDQGFAQIKDTVDDLLDDYVTPYLDWLPSDMWQDGSPMMSDGSDGAESASDAFADTYENNEDNTGLPDLSHGEDTETGFRYGGDAGTSNAPGGANVR
jgi:hypothetical protein